MKKIKRKLEELDELKSLTEADRQIVLNEYNEGYQFLLCYGKIAFFILVGIGSAYLSFIIKDIHLTSRLIIYIAISYIIKELTKMIEVNIVGKKAIKDLIKDLETKKGKEN